MRRRDFITLLGAAAAWPLAARAQHPGRLYRIGFSTLGVGPTPATEAFQDGLRQLGYVERSIKRKLRLIRDTWEKELG